MFGSLFRTAGSRARPFGAGGLALFIAVASELPACATTASSASAETAAAEYARPAPAGPSVAQSDAADRLDRPLLERGAYVRAVLRRNPSLELARQSWRGALARAEQAGTLEDPMVDLGVAPLSLGAAHAPLGYELGLSQRLPWFGKRALETSAAAAEADASKSDYETTRRELALAALVLYDRYFVALRAIEINQHHVELMRLMRDAATAQFQAGRGAAQDSLQAEAELAHMEHDSVVLASQRDVTVAQMNELLSRAPELPLPPPADLPLPLLPNPRDAERLEQGAVQRRAEIAAARKRARAAQARADRAGRDYYPDVTVSSSYNSMWDTPEHRWTVGLGFNLPIQLGRRAGAADEALALRAQFESEASRLSDAARTQVYVALAQLQESGHVLGVFEQRLLPLAREQIDAARAGFTASQSSFSSVLEAERNLRSVELGYQMARAECDQHRAELDRALGRIPGLEAELDQP